MSPLEESTVDLVTPPRQPETDNVRVTFAIDARAALLGRPRLTGLAYVAIRPATPTFPIRRIHVARAIFYLSTHKPTRVILV